jgi:DNA-binding GntR family transcriptional regulator
MCAADRPDHRRTTSDPDAAERLAAELRARIRGGELRSGARLRQTDVAREHALEVPVARAAIGILGRQGLARQDEKGGAVIYRPTHAEIDESFDIRVALECLAIEGATPLATEERLDCLDAIVQEMRLVLRTDLQRHVEVLNHRFHATIYAIGGRPQLQSLIEEAQQASRAFVALATDEARQPDAELAAHIHAEHVAIMRALRARDAGLASERLRAHLEWNRRRVHASWHGSARADVRKEWTAGVPPLANGRA